MKIHENYSHEGSVKLFCRSSQCLNCSGDNLASEWHNMIVEILKELCQEYVEKGKYKKVKDGNIEPIPVSYRKHVYLYRPDLYAIWSKTEEVDVYEVIDTESEGEAVMDIVYSALTPRISNLCMVFSDNTRLETMKKHAQIILSKIFTEDKESFMEFNPRYFVYVPKEARVKKTVKNQLRERLEF